MSSPSDRPLAGKTVAFLVAPEGIEQVELTEPWKAVQEAGGTPRLVSTQAGEVQAYHHLDKGDTFPVDETVETIGTGKAESKGRQRFKRWLVRFGVPGASLLAPLAIPSHFTAAMLVAAGIPRARVLLWQAIAIVAWTILTTTLVWLAGSALLG